MRVRWEDAKIVRIVFHLLVTVHLFAILSFPSASPHFKFVREWDQEVRNTAPFPDQQGRWVSGDYNSETDQTTLLLGRNPAEIDITIALAGDVTAVEYISKSEVFFIRKKNDKAFSLHKADGVRNLEFKIIEIETEHLGISGSDILVQDSAIYISALEYVGNKTTPSGQVSDQLYNVKVLKVVDESVEAVYDLLFDYYTQDPYILDAHNSSSLLLITSSWGKGVHLLDEGLNEIRTIAEATWEHESSVFYYPTLFKDGILVIDSTEKGSSVFHYDFSLHKINEFILPRGPIKGPAPTRPISSLDKSFVVGPNGGRIFFIDDNSSVIDIAFPDHNDFFHNPPGNGQLGHINHSWGIGNRNLYFCDLKKCREYRLNTPPQIEYFGLQDEYPEGKVDIHYQEFDADGDNLDCMYPQNANVLNEKLQIYFGNNDVGAYELEHSCSDGLDINVTIGYPKFNILNTNDTPEIDTTSLSPFTRYLAHPASLNFTPTTHDSDWIHGDTPDYKWFQNGSETATIKDFTFHSNKSDPGEHRLRFLFTDDSGATAEQTITVHVYDVASLFKDTHDFGKRTIGHGLTLSLPLVNNGDPGVKVILESISFENGPLSTAALLSPLDIAPKATEYLSIIYRSDDAGVFNQKLHIAGKIHWNNFELPFKDTLVVSVEAAIAEGSAIEQIFPDVLTFGKIPSDGPLDTVLTLINGQQTTITLDKVEVSSAEPEYDLVAELPAAPVILAAGEETKLRLKILPKTGSADALRARIRFTGQGDFGENNLTFTDEIQFNFSLEALQEPEITSFNIVPKEFDWDTASTVELAIAGKDRDGIGSSMLERVVVVYAKSGDTLIDTNTTAFAIKASRFRIGLSQLNAFGVDNEGQVNSSPEVVNVVVSDKPAHVYLDSVGGERRLILRGFPSRLVARAWDADEFATPSQDSLKSVKWFSTLHGDSILAQGKTATLTGTQNLRLGLHGIYLEVVDNEGTVTRSDTSFVPVQQGLGNAVIVAGTAFGDYRYFFNNIAPTTNWVYSKLRQRGFTDEQIEYFNPVGWQSLKSPLENDEIVDQTEVTIANLKATLAQLQEDTEKGIPLTLIFVGHGSAGQQLGKFYLNEEESITPDSLSNWLGDIRNPAEVPVTVLLDFCYAGTFQRKLASENRIIITSSDASRPAYFVAGRSFSSNFFAKIAKGSHLEAAFQTAKAWSDVNGPGEDPANPLAGADGNILTNEMEDFARMRKVYLGGAQEFQGLENEWVEVTAALGTGNKIRVSAKLKDDASLDEAWATLLSDFNPSQGNQSLPSVTLSKSSPGIYEGEFTSTYPLLGDVLVTAQGRKDGQILMPFSASIHFHPVNLSHGALGSSGYLAKSGIDGSVNINLYLAKNGPVEIDVFGIQGRESHSSFRGYLAAGSHQIELNRGRKSEAGVYWVRVVGPGIRKSMPVVVGE